MKETNENDYGKLLLTKREKVPNNVDRVSQYVVKLNKPTFI